MAKAQGHSLPKRPLTLLAMWLCSKATARGDNCSRKLRGRRVAAAPPPARCPPPLPCLLFPPFPFQPIPGSGPILEKISTLVVHPTLRPHSTLGGPSRAQLGFLPGIHCHIDCAPNCIHFRPILGPVPPSPHFPSFPGLCLIVNPPRGRSTATKFSISGTLTHSYTEGPLRTSSQVRHPLIESPGLSTPIHSFFLVFVCQHIFPTASGPNLAAVPVPSMNALIPPLQNCPSLFPFTLVRTYIYIASNLPAKSLFWLIFSPNSPLSPFNNLQKYRQIHNNKSEK